MHTRSWVALVLGATIVIALCGCGPHAYLEDYFADNGGFAYMNPPRNLEGPGTIVQLQGEGMLTVFAKDSAFPDIPILPGDMQFADFDTRTEWRGSLSLAFDFVSSGASPGKLKAALVTAEARSSKFRFGPAKKKVVELGRAGLGQLSAQLLVAMRCSRARRTGGLRASSKSARRAAIASSCGRADPCTPSCVRSS